MRSCDHFGIPISLTFKQDSIYKTTIGGLLTILAYLFIAFYAASLFKDVFTRKKHISTNQFLAEFDREEVLTPSDFSLAILVEATQTLSLSALVKSDQDAEQSVNLVECNHERHSVVSELNLTTIGQG